MIASNGVSARAPAPAGRGAGRSSTDPPSAPAVDQGRIRGAGALPLDVLERRIDAWIAAR